MLNRLSKKHSTLAVLLCLLMVLTIPSGTVFADTTSTTGKSVKSATWDQFSKIENMTNDTVEGVDLSMYQTNLGWKKEFTDYKQETVKNLMTFIKSQGVNTVTVKVAVNPSAGDQEQKNLCTLESGIKTLKTAKAAGLKKATFTPDMITIGNSVNYNFLGYTGDDAYKGWKAMGDISGIIKAYDKNIQISLRHREMRRMLHPQTIFSGFSRN